MKAVNVVKTAVWVALLAGFAAAQLKYVAVVETGIDERSGAAAEITSAEVALVTAELRREAVKNLSRDKYSVMTSETVQSMGGAILEECSEENCVVTLGSRIGADYIVRGVISKLRAKFTLSVEIYETDNGTLLASSEPIRSESVEELVGEAAAACAAMYKTFASEQNSTARRSTPRQPEPEPEPAPTVAEPAPAKHRPASLPSKPKSASADTINVPKEARTISEAISMARIAVLVAPGVYRERVVMEPGMALVSTAPFGAKIDGTGLGIVITMAKNSSVTGFEVRNGTIGILCSDSGNEIRRCRIIENGMTGIMAKRNLPQIEDNIIAFNGASGIQAWDIRGAAAAVNHNTIAYNGNHGIAVGGASEFVILNNVIAFNEWHGLKISQGSKKIQVSGNNFYGNLFQIGKILPENNYAFDPAFVKPLAELNFNSDPGKCCKEKSASGENLGARLGY